MKKMLDNLIKENEKKIEKFGVDAYLANNDYAVASALSALETTNEIQKCYFHLYNYEERLEFNVMKLYALFQSLFVSVDSLYALAYSLTKNKNFININKNKDLRELKFIRNDVVGHPANRVYDSNALAYCILDNSSVKHSTFSYKIYTSQGVEVKTVEIERLVISYYQECNNLLEELYKVASDDMNRSLLLKSLNKVIDNYLIKGDFQKQLLEFEKEYKKQYQEATSDQHRVLWRLELIYDLKKFACVDQEILDLVEYAIGLELLKIYQLISGKEYDFPITKRKPSLVSDFYRFLKKNDSFIDNANILYDCSNPMFLTSLNIIKAYASKSNYNSVLKYLNLISDLYNKKVEGLVYALALPLKEFKKK